MQEDRHKRADRRSLTKEPRADALALGPVGLVSHHADRDMDLVGVRVERGGDRVHARCEALEDVEQLLRLADDAGEIGDEIDELSTPDVLLRQRLVFGAQQRLQGGRRGPGAVFRKLVDAAARQLADAEPRAEGFLKRDFHFVVVENALGAGKAKRLERSFDSGIAVGRVDAYGIAGRVDHTLFEGEFNVDRLLFGVGAGQAVVDQNFRLVRLVAGVRGDVAFGPCFSGYDRLLSHLLPIIRPEMVFTAGRCDRGPGLIRGSPAPLCFIMCGLALYEVVNRADAESLGD